MSKKCVIVAGIIALAALAAAAVAYFLMQSKAISDCLGCCDDEDDFDFDDDEV